MYSNVHSMTKPGTVDRECLIISLTSLLLVALLAIPAVSAAHDPNTLIWPGDLRYLGAFRVPQESGDSYGWNYGGGGLAYNPVGDPEGPNDGYLGSIFGVGHDVKNEVTEISIPVPKRSSQKDASDLNTATVLQPFSSITEGIFTPPEDGLVLHMDIEYLPAKGGQTSPKLYIVWGEHFQYDQAPSHAWSEIDLSAPQTKGPWRIGDYSNFATSDYLFSIPDRWAASHTGGLSLATGRFRDGSLGGSGPALFAIGPWLEGNPPPSGATLDQVVPLLLYEMGYEGSKRVMAGYTEPDEWSGGSWVSAGNRSAVVFVGTKGRGSCWYGFANGVIWPDEPPYPPIPDPPNDERGWWSNGLNAVITFFDPADLAAVADGTKEAWEPQPYAEMVLDGFLYDISWAKEKRRLGAATFDPGKGILYVSEFRGDEDRPLIHAWKVRQGPLIQSPGPSVAGISPSYGKSGRTVIVWNLAGACFTNGASVTLTKRGQSPIVASSVRVRGDGMITCRFSVPSGVSRGLWDVVVENPDGKQGSLKRVFFLK